MNPVGRAEPGRFSAGALAAGYEALRREAVDRRDGSSGLGEALLRSRGLAAWMVAWARTQPPAEPRRPSPSPTPGMSPRTGRGEIAAVLARMALCAGKEV